MNELSGKVIGRYRIDSLLGKGSMAAVYRAQDTDTSQTVALKLIHPEFAQNPAFRARFLEIGQKVIQLDHPSIVKTYQFGEQEGLLYTVMALLPSTSLHTYLTQIGQKKQFVNLREALALTGQVAEALAQAHRYGIVHGNIKPENILLTRRETAEQSNEPPIRAIVTDFELAKLLEDDMQTVTGGYIGMLPYMAPEQCLETGFDARSDIYSLGIILYQMVTGRLPFLIKTPLDAIEMHPKKTPPQPSKLRPDLPSQVEALIARAIFKDPAGRFQTADQMATATRKVYSLLPPIAGATPLEPNSASLTRQVATAMAMTGTQNAVTQQLTGNHSLLTNLEEAPIALPGEEQLLITHPQRAPRAMLLTKTLMNIGRLSDNDIVLETPDVSRRHARLERGAHGWEITDLASTSGVVMGAENLQPNIPHIWDGEQTLHIGPYSLRLQPAGHNQNGRATPAEPYSMGANTPLPARRDTYLGRMGAAMPANAPLAPNAATAMQQMAVAAAADLTNATPIPSGAAQVSSNNGLFNMVVQPTSVDVQPGERAIMEIVLTNQGFAPDYFKLTVDGLPANWFTLRRDTIPINQGEHATVELVIHPPEDSQAHAGHHTYHLKVSANSNPLETALLSGEVTVGALEQFKIEVEPTRVTKSGLCEVRILNAGNTELTLAVLGKDAENELQFEGERGRIKVPAGKVARIPLMVKPRSQPLMGSKYTVPFEVLARSQNGDMQRAAVQLEVQPRIPLWAGGAAIGVLLLLLAILILPAIPAFSGDATFETTPLTAVQLTQTTEARATMISLVATQTAVAANQIGATQTAVAAAAEGDSDGDGLSDTREAELNTDPNNVDTDGDGLSDGREVNEFQTNPLNRDTDGDTLLDGEEVDVHGTSPLSTDTDGDGVLDGVEVAQGTDPLQPPATPTPTLTITPSPTNEPTQASTSVPSATPNTQATAAAATATAAAAAAVGDNDSDGLSNAQEDTLGTNPNSSDTDGDGLLDGEEVNIHGTSPTNTDSDGDGLSDGDEVKIHRTVPTNADTDGDGVVDGVEIRNGTDPLRPPTPTPTITSTSTSTPTNTPTSTPTSTSTPDIVAPVITLLGNATMTVSAGSTFNDPGATATDSTDGNLTSDIVVTGNVNTTAPNTYTLTYNVSDSSGNAATSVMRTVIVEDDTPPVITLVGGSTINHPFNTPYNDPGANATDNVDGNLTGDIVIGGTVTVNTLGSYDLTYNVTDSSGNPATQVIRTVTVVDNIPPTITLNGFSPVNHPAKTPYNDPGANATDNADGNITGSIVIGGDTVDTNTPGIYVITYNVTDSSGNPAAQVTRTVDVFDNIAPVINLSGSATITHTQGTEFIDPGATASDNVDGDISGNIAIGGDAVDDTTGIGVYMITYNVVDSSDNPAAEVIRTVTVE